jgi:hypothetical protein
MPIVVRNCGLKPFKGFHSQTEPLTAWCGGRWVFYTDREFAAEQVAQWMEWWEEAAQLYERITSQPQQLEADPNFGLRKVVAIAAHPFWGLGNGQRVEISRSALDGPLMGGNLATKDKHGIIFYELGRRSGYL